ncbi:hypothetical protein A0H81_04986 [Grifola frondosa]|uniref:Uncharacterized protein n=1 Tax=Grifola frondosa TaxID=5627 RepID=A0A1C7MJS5_GRIFR|nr:hypothetical protein A0H81_04986 [Grifola frondosa]
MPKYHMRRLDFEDSSDEEEAFVHDDKNPKYGDFYREVMREVRLSRKRGWAIKLPDQIQTALDVWDTITERVAFMPALIDDLAMSSTGILLISAFLDAHAQFARTDDVAMLRYDAMGYIEEVVLPNNTPIRYLAGRTKHLRGFKDLATARLLTPRLLRDQFDRNPQLFCREVREGTIKIKSADFPSFMYPENGFNVDRAVIGLCKGPFLLRCFRHVFTGKRSATVSATAGSKGGPKPVAELNGMDAVTPENIAYVAVLARFVLNDQETWQAENRRFNNAEFFDGIILAFKDPVWRASTLKWWNEEVFGITDTDDSDDENHMLALILSQRAAQQSEREELQYLERQDAKLFDDEPEDREPEDWKDERDAIVDDPEVVAHGGRDEDDMDLAGDEDDDDDDNARRSQDYPDNEDGKGKLSELPEWF